MWRSESLWKNCCSGGTGKQFSPRPATTRTNGPVQADLWSYVGSAGWPWNFRWDVCGKVGQEAAHHLRSLAIRRCPVWNSYSTVGIPHCTSYWLPRFFIFQPIEGSGQGMMLSETLAISIYLSVFQEMWNEYTHVAVQPMLYFIHRRISSLHITSTCHIVNYC